MMLIVIRNKDNTTLNGSIEKGIIITIIIHFIYTLKSKVQALFSSVHIVRNKYNASKKV